MSVPGYNSQRCFNCDHIRAAHALTANGCLGHAGPGWVGADCPCSEFMDSWLESNEGQEHTRQYMLMYEHRLAENTADCCQHGCPCYSTPGYYQHLYQLAVEDAASRLKTN